MTNEHSRRKVLVIGHWDLSGPDLSGGKRSGVDVLVLPDEPEAKGMPPFGDDKAGATLEVLSSIKTGLVENYERLFGQWLIAPEVLVETLPFGPGAAAELAARAANSPVRVIADDRAENSSYPLGAKFREAIMQAGSGEGANRIALEAGHSEYHDWGLGFLEALIGLEQGHFDQADPKAVEESLPEALEEAKELLEGSGASVTFAASTDRPLVGAGSPAELNPDLSLRYPTRTLGGLPLGGAPYIALQEAVRKVLLNAAQCAQEPDGHAPTDPTRIDGSGAAGGVAALLSALGVPIINTYALLSEVTDLKEKVRGADLVVVAEPHLDVPELSDLGLTQITAATAQSGVPTIGVGVRSSLSSVERAELGLQAQTLLSSRKVGRDAFEDVGRRIAQTWLRPNAL